MVLPPPPLEFFTKTPSRGFQEKVIAERENALLKEQELYNRLRNKEYGPAIALALDLKRPQKLWGVLRDAMTEGMGEGASAGGDEGECIRTEEMAPNQHAMVLTNRYVKVVQIGGGGLYERVIGCSPVNRTAIYARVQQWLYICAPIHFAIASWIS